MLLYVYRNEAFRFGRYAAAVRSRAVCSRNAYLYFISNFSPWQAIFNYTMQLSISVMLAVSQTIVVTVSGGGKAADFFGYFREKIYHAHTRFGCHANCDRT